MIFMPFVDDGRRGLAVVEGARAIDLAAMDAGLPAELDDVMAGGRGVLQRIRAAMAGAGPGQDPATLAPRYPVAGPHKVICLGLNYAAHAREGGNSIPDYPAFFLRGRESMTVAGGPILRPPVSERLDYEAELMVVIGARASRIREEDALAVVFGYTIFNDGTVRDYQRKSSQWTAGKNFDGTGAVGPVVVTADALPPGAEGLRISSRVNGATIQDSNTSDMIFGVARAVSIVSEFTTLNPGDMIAMGTPPGVGYARQPPVFLRAGDIVEVEIEGIGVLRNVVADA